jgi:hypothetical protein
MEYNPDELEQIENTLANFTLEDRDEATELVEKCIFESKYYINKQMKTICKFFY